MNFDFTNYTFCFVTTLISSILGITYPLLMSSVNKIESKYHSSAIMLRFQNEKALKLYKASLVIAFSIAFIAPFLMLWLNNAICNVIIILIQSVSVLFLVSVTLVCFSLVMKYNMPKYLLNVLKPEKNGKVSEDGAILMECAADLMVYSSVAVKADLYAESKSVLFQLIYSEQPLKNVESYELKSSTKDILLYLTDYAQRGNPAPLCNDNLIVQTYYNCFIDCYNSNANYEVIWKSLNKMATSNNAEWFKQYWMSTVEYYSFYIEQKLISNRGLFERYSEDFKVFHVMLGAMLLFNGKYDWLTFMLTKDYTDPAQFKVIPGSVRSIIYFIGEIEKQKQESCSFVSQYQMQGMFYDTKVEEQILMWAYRYCALLFIRLLAYPDINGHYDSPLSIPPRRTSEQKKYAEKIEKEIMEFWYKDNRIKNICFPKEVEQMDVVELLNKFFK